MTLTSRATRAMLEGGEVEGDDTPRLRHLGFGRIASAEIEAPNMLAIPLWSG
jgi:hypothetical protein